MEPKDQVSIAVVEEHQEEMPKEMVIDQVLIANQNHPDLEPWRMLARQKESQDFTLDNGYLTRRDKLVVPDQGILRTELIREVHAGLPTAHPGQDKTYAYLTSRFWWPNMRKDSDQYVKNCLECCSSKVLKDKTPGLLKPLPVPERPWRDSD